MSASSRPAVVSADPTVAADPTGAVEFTAALSAVDLMPHPRSENWGVTLAYADGVSDKGYRIAVLGSQVFLQWGRRGSTGQLKRVSAENPAAALSLARKRWAAKEAKGYWPVTGVVPLDLATVDDVCRDIIGCLAEGSCRSSSELEAVAPGDLVVIVQTPFAWPWAGSACAALSDLADRGGVLLPGRELSAGRFALLAVDEPTLGALEAVCPIVVPVGSRRNRDTSMLSEVSMTLLGASDSTGRAAAARAITNARAVLA